MCDPRPKDTYTFITQAMGRESNAPARQEGIMHGRRQQKKLEKKNTKRRERRQSARAMDNNEASIISDAIDGPIVEARIPESLWSGGIGVLSITRSASNGYRVVGHFLVDAYCLGVKDAFLRVLPPSQYSSHMAKVNKAGRTRRVSPEYLAKIVRGAVDYAARLGFAPHADYDAPKRLIDNIDSSLCSEEFEFGKDGKPFYTSGPHDSPARADAIVKKIQQVGGHFLIRVPGAGADMEDLDLESEPEGR